MGLVAEIRTWRRRQLKEGRRLSAFDALAAPDHGRLPASAGGNSADGAHAQYNLDRPECGSRQATTDKNNSSATRLD